MPIATDPTGGQRTLVSSTRQRPQFGSRFAKTKFEKDEEKPSASKKRRSLLTQVLSLVGGPSRPGNRELTAKKARTILTEGRAQGQPLSARQKRFFGAIAGGEKERR